MRQTWKSLAVAFGCVLGTACGSSRGNPDAAAASAPASSDAEVDVMARAEAAASTETTGLADTVAEPSGAGGADVRGEARDANEREIAVDAGDASTDAGPTLPARVLLYHFSTLVIDSVPAQLTFYENLLAGWGYASDDSVDPGKFTDAGLAAYGAVAMVNTCFFPFGDGKDGAKESAVLQRFVARGGGLFGTHCAAVTFQNVSPPPLYNQVFGGQEGNGFFDGASGCRKVGAGTHATTEQLPAAFDFLGNLDNNQFLFPSTTITVRCKWSGGEMRDVAVSWFRTEGQGRVFYTNFGKVVGDLTDPVLGAKHIVPGLAWVLGR